jgi:hypothetical protein
MNVFAASNRPASLQDSQRNAPVSRRRTDTRRSRCHDGCGRPQRLLAGLVTDDLEEPGWERPTRLLRQADASASEDQIGAPEPRPERASGVREPRRPLPRDERAWEASMERLEVVLRREAVRRRLAGELPEVIAGELGRTCRRGTEPRLDRAPPDRRHPALGRRGAARSVRRGPQTARRRARTAAVRGRLLTLTRRMETEHQSSRSADRGRCCR